jgi:hypothetical protein
MMAAQRYFTEPQNPIGELPAIPRIAIVSRLLTNASPIGFAIRDETGWQLFAGDESPEFSDDAKNFSPDLVSMWMDRDPAFRLALVRSDWHSFQRSLEDVLYELAQRGDSFLVCADPATDRYVQFRDWYNPAPLRRISELAVYTLRHLHHADLARIDVTLELR